MGCVLYVLVHATIPKDQMIIASQSSSSSSSSSLLLLSDKAEANEYWGKADRFIHKEGNVLFHDAHNTFYLRLYGVGHMVKDHTYSERGNPLPPYGLSFLISRKRSFICIIPQTG